MQQEEKKVADLYDKVKEYITKLGKNKQGQIIGYSKTQSNERVFMAAPIIQDK